MGENSGIAWTDNTFNPWVGCTKVSPGCDHCYAEAWDKRYSDGAHWGPGAPRRRTSVQNWNKVWKWDREAAAAGKRTRVFCASLADVFDNEVPQEWREDLWKLIAETPNLDWILVTKRVGNVERMAPDASVFGQPIGLFPSNVIILSTIVNQAEATRDLGKLVRLKRDGIVSKIGVSYEPAIGPVDWSPWIADMDWLIPGGESDQGGAKARPFRMSWGLDAIWQAAGTGRSVFQKQMGSSPIDADGNPVTFCDRAGADPEEWPAGLRVRQFPVIGGGNG